MKTINILDIPISQITNKEAVDGFLKLAQDSEKKHFVATPNAEIILKAQKDLTLKKFLQTSNLNFPDATSLLWAGEYKAKKWGKFRAILELLFLPFRKNSWTTFPERVTGSDSFEKICEEAEKENFSIALIGGSKNVANKTGEKLTKNFPKLKIVATIDGLPFEDFWKMEILKKLEGAQIIFVALGCPNQERWIAENLAKISSARVAIGIGGSFDFYIGKLSRAPQWMRNMGIEWLFRLILEPKRWKRIFQAVFIFPYKILC